VEVSRNSGIQGDEKATGERAIRQAEAAARRNGRIGCSKKNLMNGLKGYKIEMADGTIVTMTPTRLLFGQKSKPDKRSPEQKQQDHEAMKQRISANKGSYSPSTMEALELHRRSTHGQKVRQTESLANRGKSG